MASIGTVAGLGFSILLLYVGGALLRSGYRTRERAAAISAARPRTPGEVSESDVFVVVSGRARAAGETTRAELLGERALLVQTVVESETSSGSNTSDHESSEAVPFVLEGEDGEVSVDLPEEAAVELSFEREVSVSHDASTVQVGAVPEDVPDGVREYIEGHDTAATGTRRYRQGAVRPGQRVTVAGEVTAASPDSEGPEVAVTGVGHPEWATATDGVDLSEPSASEWRIPLGFGAIAVLGGLLVGWIAASNLTL